MIFKKKKKMIDVRELQRRGVVRIPKKDIVVPTNQEGFVELGSGGNATTSVTPSPSTNSEFFGFMDTPSTTPTSTSTDTYDKREIDEKITNLDNKIYRLEQRLELIEKKLDISSSNDSDVGPMGW